jgi:hypothetical protein
VHVVVEMTIYGTDVGGIDDGPVVPVAAVRPGGARVFR